MTTKKKLIMSTFILFILVLSAASVTLSYFTDTHSVQNTFVVGNLDIKFVESEVVQNQLGHIVKKEGGNFAVTPTTFEYGKSFGSLFPMQTIYKDPSIVNVGSEKAFVGAIIEIKTDANVTDLIGSAYGNGSTPVYTFFNGLLENSNDYKVNVTEDTANKVIKIYIIKNAALDGAQQAQLTDESTESIVPSVTFFKGITIPAEWGNEQMAKLKGLTINVTAYAAQTSGFADAESAFKAAFKSEFENVTFPTVTPEETPTETPTETPEG